MIADRAPAAYVARPAFQPRFAGDRIEGRLGAGTRLRIGVLLRYRNEAALRQLVRLQNDRHSPLFKHYLTRQQWNAAFAPDPQTVDRTMRSLERAGFHLHFLASNRGFALLDTTASAVERTFSTELRSVVRRGRHGFANVRGATVPADVRDGIAGISGLSNFPAVRPPEHRITHYATFGTPAFRQRFAAAPSASPSPKPVSTSTPAPNPSPEAPIPTAAGDITNGTGNGYGPAVYAVSYDFPVLHGYAGRGRVFADAIGSMYDERDLQNFLTANNITRTGKTVRVPVDGGPTLPVSEVSGGFLEASADVQVAVGLAPGMDYYEYAFPETSFDYQVEDAYNQIVADDVADVASSSFGDCENYDPAIEYAEGYLAMQGAAKGITFVAATGDQEGLACYLLVEGMPVGATVSVFEPAADQYFTAVGGTTLLANTMTGAYESETADPAGGGGVSIYEARPDWQASTAGTSSAGRTIPDVALDASEVPGFETWFDGTSVPAGGTSIATPAFGALIAEIDEIENTRNGWINPRLYQIYNAQGYAFAFRDITSGTNGTQTAGTGYDQATGIGSPLGWELAGEL